MALSERERQMLEEMEDAIRAEDPRFASQMNGVHSGRGDRRRVVTGVVGAIAGLGLVLMGINTTVWVGVAGFALIVASVAFALTPGSAGPTTGLGVVDATGKVKRPRPRKARKAGAAGSVPHASFMQRMEQRWEKRRQQGQGW